MSHRREKPLDCTGCSKPATVRYTQMVGKDPVFMHMCETCPVLEQLIQGTSPLHPTHPNPEDLGLCCGSCGTTLASLKTEGIVGCEECYEVFTDFLMNALTLSREKKVCPIYIGLSPKGDKKQGTQSLSTKLKALNEALNETLSREDYEHAAWLRDEIKKLTKESPKK